MKIVYFIIQRKGGVGKSILSYNAANLALLKGIEVLFIDFDNETRTSTNQLNFIDARPFNLIDKHSKQIDRTRLDSFFEEMAEQETFNQIVCDLGATSSEQFLKYIETDEGSIILETLKEMGIDLRLICVVGGDNSYPACADFCENLFKVSNGLTNNEIYINKYFAYSTGQLRDLRKISDKFKAPIQEFTIVDEKGNKCINEIKKLMEQGKPAIEKAPLLTKKRYLMNLEKMVFFKN